MEPSSSSLTSRRPRTPSLIPATPPDGDAVAAAFDLGRPIDPPAFAARGELGRIWRLETSTGVWAVKELLQRADEQEAMADVVFQEAAIAAGIAMPRPVISRAGTALAVIGPAGAQVTVRVYGWVDLAPGPVPAPAGEAASILGRLHGLGIAAEGPPDPWFTDVPGLDRWHELLGRARLARADWRPAFEALVPVLIAGYPIISIGEHRPTMRCHLDFNPENVLMDARGRAVTLDWENSGAASAEQELASVLAEFVPDPAGAPEFHQAYSDAGGPALVRDRSSFAMTLAVQANLAAWYAERALEDQTTAEDRARSAHWIEDIAANVFTLDRIDAWLAALDRG
jgi:Ser/Thr protein kinase RdoA (MazF antagonist)